MTNQLRKVSCSCLVITVSGVSLVAIASAAIYFAAQYRAGTKVDSQLAELSERGIPITPEDLHGYYVVPQSEADVTDLWLKALAPLASPDFRTDAEGLPLVDTDQPIPPPGTVWDELDGVRSLLQKYSVSLQLLHEAASQGPSARFDTLFENGLEMQLPHAQNLRVGARMLSLEAHVRARDGDAAGAVKSLQACFRLSRALEREPVLVSQPVRFACSAMALHQVTDLVPYLQISDEELKELQVTIRESDYRDGWCLSTCPRSQRILSMGRPYGITSPKTR